MTENRPILNSFNKIRDSLTQNCQNALAEIAGKEHPLADDLDTLWDTIESYLINSNLEKIDTILAKWSNLLPKDDSTKNESGLQSAINTIFIQVWRHVPLNLDPETSIQLFQQIFPFYLHVNKQIYQYELRNNTNALSDILQGTQSNLDTIERNKSKFIRIAAHELKTPLTIINGYVTMLHEMLGEEKGDLLEIVQGISTGTNRLRILVQDLIDVSLIDNRLLDFAIQPVWLDRIIENVCLEYSEILNKRHQMLSIVPFDEFNQMLYSDPDRLRQVFKNIISNAIKYTPDGGKISISGRKLPGFIELVVTDSGVGIAPENQILIFDKFIHLGEFDKHSSSKTKYKGGGPGLGLHITKGILEAMGGSIWVESTGFDEKKCPGASFHVLIPLDQRTLKANIVNFLND